MQPGAIRHILLRETHGQPLFPNPLTE